MARKGSQKRNGLHRNTSNKKHTFAEPTDGCLLDEKERSTHNRKIDREDASNSDPPTGSGNDSHEKLNNNSNMGNGKRNTQRPGHGPHRETLEHGTVNLTQPLDDVSKTSDLAGNDLLSDTSTSSREDGILFGSCVHNLVHDSLSLIVSVGKRLEALAFFIFNATNGWLERQKPHLAVLATAMCAARDYICARVKHVSPIIWMRLEQLGKLVLLLSMVWLDCAIRGLDSLLRLGTTSFFTVIWCSIFSIIGMIGITKMLIFTVVAALLMIFINFVLALLTSIIFSTVILWLYGSFWMTGFVILLGGVAFALSHERVALFVTTLYSMHCARIYTGWIGLLLGLNLSFITSDVLFHFLKSMDERAPRRSSGQRRHNQGGESHFFGEPLHSSPADDVSPPSFASANVRSPDDPSTTGSEADLTSESEVARLLNCNDHYSVLNLTRYGNIDASSLKREYKKKAMLVHPDKNMGNEKAAEAFKKLQNAYEVLSDSSKQKAYDDELKREELLNYLRKFHSASQNVNGRNGIFSSGFTHFEAEDGGSNGDSRRIRCDKCSNFHIWSLTQRLKSHARWCQDCNEFHQAKDGDGWVEQAFHPLLFGLLHKMEAPCAYVCADNRIYDATEWFFCQGMRCPANTHRPSFHVNTSTASKQNAAKGGTSAHRSSGGMPSTGMDETMTEEEFFEWFQNAVQSSMFDTSNMSGESPSARAGGSSKGNVKKKRKGKKQW